MGKRMRLTTSATIWFLVLFGAILVFPSQLQGQEWTRFRGPDGQGISEAKTIPVKWTEKDYNWKIELPGAGHSSPVIWGDRVFVTCGGLDAGRGALVAIGVSDGAVLWKKEYSPETYKMNKLNSYASSTPAVDADCVYVLWPSADQTILAALDHDGREIWRKTFDGYHCQHGAGTSPIIVDDLVIFTQEHEKMSTDVDSWWIALDRKSGQTRWKLSRKTGPKTSYSTPCFYSPAAGAPQLIFNSNSHGITAVDPRNGTVIWQVESALPNRIVSSPVIAGGLIIGTCGDGGSGKRLIAIRPGSSDKSAPPEEAYKIEDSSATYVPTAVATDGLLFTFHDRGDVSCLRSATGERLWRERPAGKFFGSPVCVDGKLYCMTTDGDVVVIKAAETYELLGLNHLGETSHATPAVAGGRMYLRTYSHLFSIGGK